MAKKAKKAVKKSTVVAGVDLKALTAKQKIELRCALDSTFLDDLTVVKNEKIEKLKEDGVWAEYEAELKQLIKECKGLSKKHVLELMVPLTLTFSLEEAVSSDLVGSWSSWISHNYSSITTGKVGPVEGLTKKQQKMLQDGIEDVIGQACEDILTLLPAEVQEKYAALDKKVNALRSKLEKHGLEDDLV